MQELVWFFNYLILTFACVMFLVRKLGTTKTNTLQNIILPASFITA